MESQREKFIGVLDSGLGGLTVVRELERILPNESIVYFGDNANCPYGNRQKEEILNLSHAMLDFLQNRGVKIAAIACNTISTLVAGFRTRYGFPVVSIIEEACNYIARENLEQIAVFATEFTIKQGFYNTLLGQLSPETRVYGIPSRALAALVDEGDFYSTAIYEEVRSLLKLLRQNHPEVKHAVLGCTHYPIVQDIFEKEAPDISFINPAAVQADAVKALLTEGGLLNDTPAPLLDINTTGKKQPYEAAVKKLAISRPFAISAINSGVS